MTVFGSLQHKTGDLHLDHRKELQTLPCQRHPLFVRNLTWTEEGSLRRVALGVVFILGYLPVAAYQLTMLGDEPDWSSLDMYQETMSLAELEDALNRVYLPYGYDQDLIKIFPEYVLIKMDSDRPDSFLHASIGGQRRFRKFNPAGGT